MGIWALWPCCVLARPSVGLGVEGLMAEGLVNQDLGIRARGHWGAQALDLGFKG